MNNINYYAYFRVSTNKQKIDRQDDALKEYIKTNNIEVTQIFTDYYTGKTFNRENYKKLMEIIKPSDYLIVKEVDRLGRDWDGIKSEWKRLHDNNINIIIIDLPILSDPLPNQKSPLDTLETKLIKEQLLELMCYSAQKERQKISQRTKEGLKATRLKGTRLGKPKGQYNTKENFINTLEKMVNEHMGQDKATLWTKYPTMSFKNDLKKCYIKYNTKDYQEILNKIKEDTTEWEHF
ncbi:MAG: recombinase family protein [Bacilli bacterium]